MRKNETYTKCEYYMLDEINVSIDFLITVTKYEHKVTLRKKGSFQLMVWHLSSRGKKQNGNRNKVPGHTASAFRKQEINAGV